MNKFFLALVAAATLQHSLAAHSNGPIQYDDSRYAFGVTPGENLSSRFNNNHSYFIEAYRHPNATKSIPFALAGQEGWTWRVNMTDISVPDATEPTDDRDDLGEIMGPDSHLVGTTYDLQWPNKSMTIQEAADAVKKEHGVWPEVNHRLCAMHIYDPVFPNITNRYTDDKNGSCEGVIPDRCLDKLLEHGRNQHSKCSSWSFSSSGDECMGVWDRNASGSPMAGNRLESPRPYTSDESGWFRTLGNRERRMLNNSDAIWSEHSRAYSSSNQTAIEQRKSKLHVTIIGFTNHSQALCTRLDPEIDDEEVTPLRAVLDAEAAAGDDEGDDEGDEDVGENDDSAGARVVAGTAGLSVLLMVMFGMV